MGNRSNHETATKEVRKQARLQADCSIRETTMLAIQNNATWRLGTRRVSTWIRLIRTLAWVYRFVNNCLSNVEENALQVGWLPTTSRTRTFKWWSQHKRKHLEKSTHNWQVEIEIRDCEAYYYEYRKRKAILSQQITAAHPRIRPQTPIAVFACTLVDLKGLP